MGVSRGSQAKRHRAERNRRCLSADRDAQVPEVCKIGLCRRGEAGWWAQVAHWLLQVLNVQQDAGQHQQQRKRLCFVLQGLLRTKVRTKGLWIWWRSGCSQHGHWRTVWEHPVPEQQT